MSPGFLPPSSCRYRWPVMTGRLVRRLIDRMVVATGLRPWHCMMVTSIMSEGLYLAFGLGDARSEKNGSMAVDSLP